MIEFFAVLAVLMAIMGIMSIGVIMGRKPITGSCGGVGAALGEENYTCDICGGDPARCDEQDGNTDGNSTLAYEASRR